MRYHIVADPSTNQSWRTLNGSELDVDESRRHDRTVDGVEVLDRIPVRNGTVLVIPRLLLHTLTGVNAGDGDRRSHKSGEGTSQDYRPCMADDARELIRYHAEGRVGVVTIDRPEKRNAMTYSMLGEFIETVGRADDDPDTVVLVITGVPGAFCAGTDLADLATVPGEVRGLRGSAEERHKWWPIAQARKPTIGAIDGPAVGMGAEFSSQCDLRIASTQARFAWNFVHRGLVPDTGAGTWLLPRIIGLQPALKLLYTGEMIDAAEALRLGYVLDVVESDDVLVQAMELAHTRSRPGLRTASG